MPEGDTIATLAAALRPMLVGQVITGATCRWPAEARGVQGLRVRAVETRGKHLLLRLSDDTTLRVHLGMTGEWHRYAPGERWRRSRGDLALELATASEVAVCFRAPTVERIDDRALPDHPVLGSLGPDLLDPGFEPAAVVPRVRARPGPIGSVLLDQRVACGLGNVFRSELCFARRVHPAHPSDALADGALVELYRLGAAWLAAGVGGARNTTGRSAPALWVYGRAGRPCLRCRTRITAEGARDGRGEGQARPVYLCPACQPASAP